MRFLLIMILALSLTALFGLTSGCGGEDDFNSSDGDADSDSDSDGDADDDDDDDDNDDDDNDDNDNNEEYPEIEIAPENIIDDLEDGNGEVYRTIGRQGSWYTYNDETSGGEQDPTPGDEFLPTDDCGSGNSSDFCALCTGSGFTEWGAVFGFDLLNPTSECEGEVTKQPYNAEIFDGVAFMAKGNSNIRVNLPTATITSEDYGGTCEPTDDEMCDDAYGRTVYIQSETEWRQYQVRFDDIKQGGWGFEGDWDASEIMSVLFEIPKNKEFEIYIDDVGFFGPDGETNEDVYPDENEGPSDRDILAGFRSSTYGFDQGPGFMPSASSLVNVGQEMASYYDNATGSSIWIVCNAMGDSCDMIYDADSYLDAFDAAGMEIIVQVEPMHADMGWLIDEALDTYGGHSSVVGFGIDVEFLEPTSGGEDEMGRSVTDEEALEWLEQVRSYNSDYILMLKHFDAWKMPPCERDGMLFINDSQKDTEEVIFREYEYWADHLAPGDVGFQIGYETDSEWWTDFGTPPDHMGDILIEAHKNTAAIYWVDFTLDWVFDL